MNNYSNKIAITTGDPNGIGAEITIKALNLLNLPPKDIVDRIYRNLSSGITVVVHTSHLIANFDGFSEDSFNAELTKDKLTIKITDYLADLTEKVLSKINVI